MKIRLAIPAFLTCLVVSSEALAIDVEDHDPHDHHHHHEGHDHEGYHLPHQTYYQFGYQVNYDGDYHGHTEQADAVTNTRTGEFKVRLPDGRIQVTSYIADEHGFNPRVTYELPDINEPGLNPDDPHVVPLPLLDHQAEEEELLHGQQPPPRPGRPIPVGHRPRHHPRPTVHIPQGGLLGPVEDPILAVNHLPPRPTTLAPPHHGRHEDGPGYPVVAYVTPKPEVTYTVPSLHFHQKRHHQGPDVKKPISAPSKFWVTSTTPVPPPNQYLYQATDRQDDLGLDHEASGFRPANGDNPEKVYYLVTLNDPKDNQPKLALLARRKE